MELKVKESQETSCRGFSLVEVLVAIALSLVVMASVLELFRQGINMNEAATQRTELQQNIRAALNLMAQDLNIAGTGFPLGGLSLPNGQDSVAPRFGCDASGCQIEQSARNNWLYAITPGDGLGPTINGVATDVVTLVYRGPTLAFEQNTLTSIASDGTEIRCNGSTAGLQVGDVLILSNVYGSAAVVVTGINDPLVQLNANDPFRFNQPDAESGNIMGLSSPPGTFPNTTAYRVFVIRYYVDSATLRLMRQVNAQTPFPVAENVENLQITYDTFNDSTLVSRANLDDLLPVTTSGLPNQIRKINISLGVRGMSQRYYNAKFDHFTARTSVSARNLAFRDRYI
jgi:prepilin-type N-terminal cleavage/methylation domain-containing protein